MLPRTMTMAVCLLGVVFAACQNEPSGTGGPTGGSGAGSLEGLETDEQKMLYVVGMALGGQLTSVGLEESELDAIYIGIGDSAMGRESRVDIDEYGPRMNEYMSGRISERANAEGLESAAFVELQAQMEGATRTDSGVVITEIEPGDGPSPTVEDVVMVHYHGTLRDGTVFDSSVERGEPATFPLQGVIPCWTEGVQAMRVGGKSRLVCPANLAYGPNPPPGSPIPGNAALVFEVELLDIVDTSAPAEGAEAPE